MKVLFLANIPSPYRMKFFNALGRLCALTVTFEGEKATDRDGNWTSGGAAGFHAIYLKGIRTRSDQFFCPGIIHILKESYDQIVVGDYSTPTGMLAIAWLNRHHVPFWIEADGGLIPQSEGVLRCQLKTRLISSASAWLSSGEAADEYLCHYGAERERCCHYPFSSLEEGDMLQVPVSAGKKALLRGKLSIPDFTSDGRRIKEKSTDVSNTDENSADEKSGSRKLILSVGQLIPRKGYDILLRAMALCPQNYTLVIAGGKPSEDLECLRRSLNLDHVFFLPFMKKAELCDYFDAADLFVLPTREDIWGLVINEAMARGLPVITTDRCVAGLTLVRDYQNGFLVRTEDKKALADRMIEVLSSMSLREQMSAESLQTIRPYTIEAMAHAHMDAFKDTERLFRRREIS